MYPQQLHLVYYPDPILRKTAESVTEFDDDLRAFCQAMFTSMDESHGVGLAAPQVGVSKRIFVTNHMGHGDDVIPDRRIWINPRLELAGDPHQHEEGCLSIPGAYGMVDRPSQVRIHWQDDHGTEHEALFDSAAGDFLAVIVQHEFDHLEGKLFLDYLSPTHLGMVRRKLKDLEKTYKKATGKAGAPLRR